MFVGTLIPNGGVFCSWAHVHIFSLVFITDFDTPFQPPGQTTTQAGGGAGAPSDDDVAMIMSLGFSRQQALRALKATVSNLAKER